MISAEVAVHVLALVGDLSMGQPPAQSQRAARLAAQVAQLDGAGAQDILHARLVALLRWSGCTANAAGFANLLGDDVGGREAMLRHGLPPDHPLTFSNIEPLARIHCEVAGDVAGMLGLPPAVEAGLRHVWEHFDGSGAPQQQGAATRCRRWCITPAWRATSTSWAARTVPTVPSAWCLPPAASNTRHRWQNAWQRRPAHGWLCWTGRTRWHPLVSCPPMRCR
ncbi:hypothetical protein [Herbaspirillum sp. VT-16-41]|uniref:hypothetical protein n=1 Tax=Herbaspirillum sp. VT-16-41 TaxID=1953765 RepID=UPI0027BA576D|nr:hypothetical protein [Herbaspirillum sp. VT-16-41]